MSELRPFLDREARQIHSDGDALDRVLQRAERRRRARRIATGVVALAVAGGSLGLAYAAFRPGDDTRPAVRPFPGPTVTTDDGKPSALRIEVLSGTEHEAPAAYVALRLASEGEGMRDGGYNVLITGTAHQPPHTLINCPPQFDHEAEILRQALFPTARIGPALPDEDVALRITLGRDFEEQDDGGLKAFEAAEAFMGFRALRDDQAHRFLSDRAADQYHRGEGGLELFGYAEGGYRLTAMSSAGDGLFRVVVQTLTRAGGTGYETLSMGDEEPSDGNFEVMAAELNEVPPTAGIGFETIRPFVNLFLEARRERSGAGTFLGEDARTAYASNENGLDLLGYAASPDLDGARITRYDKLSPNRLRAVVRFALARPEGGQRIVWEVLFITSRDEGFLLVSDAERVSEEEALGG